MESEQKIKVLVAVATGVTVLDAPLATYRVLPSGVTARASGTLPTGIAGPGTPVAADIGVTLPEPALAETNDDEPGCDARACFSRTAGGMMRAAFTIPEVPGRRPPTIP